jgi:hypothetical protein
VFTRRRWPGAPTRMADAMKRRCWWRSALLQPAPNRGGVWLGWVA